MDSGDCASRGGGWGELSRPHRICATPLLVYFMQTDTVDIDVSGNVFEEMPHGLFHRNGFGPNETPCAGAPKGYRIHDNKVMP